MPKYTVTCPLQYLNVRAQPNNLAKILGAVKKGSIIEGVPDRGYIRILLAAGGVELNTDAYDGTQVFGYVFEPFTTLQGSAPPPITPPPTPIGKLPPIGVNIIVDGRAADRAIEMGCKYIHMTFNPDYAWVLKQRFPDLLVSARGNFYKGHLPSKAEIDDKLSPAIKPGMIVTGVNELDQIGESVDSIKKRADWDKELWNRCKNEGAIYAGSSFHMGGPNIRNSEIRKAFIDNYAPLFNAGMWLNQHLYSGNDHSGIPVKERIYKSQEWPYELDGVKVSFRQTWWLEERIRFYEMLGFNSTLPTAGKYICDEMGVDNPGPFSDFGYTAEEVADYCLTFQKLLAQPTIINGVARPLNFMGGALFQEGDTNTWNHFRVERYYQAFVEKGLWKKRS